MKRWTRTESAGGSNWLLALAACLCLAGIARGQGRAQAAIPGLTSAPLFSIAWNLTGNYVQYDAQLRDGTFDPKEPVVAYWIMKQTDSHHEPLTLFERRKGYGFSIHPGSAPDTYDMVIVSVKKKTLHVTRIGGQFDVTLSIANCEMAHLNQARVQAHRWHFITFADYVDLVGTDAKTGAVCRERVTQM
jgi:hypothetical protein